MSTFGILERTRAKEFYELLVERLGVDAWTERKSAYMKCIRDKESHFNINLPIENQIFTPSDDDINWYILASYLAYDFPYSDIAFSGRRILTYAMAIGSVAEKLRRVPNVNSVLDKMLANNNNPETQIFELLTAAFYLKNDYDVSFIPENSVLWPDGNRKSPDLLVKSGKSEFYVECKRSDKQTKYSRIEQDAWDMIWTKLSERMLKFAPWKVIDLTFHDQVTNVPSEDVIRAAELIIKANGELVTTESISGKLRAIDKMALKRHYKKYLVSPNSAQQELLIFGDIDSNEKRSTATIARQVVKCGAISDVLNFYIKDIAHCVGAQWRCDHASSISARSKHFKSLINDGVSQIPPDRPGIVHVWYETRDGIAVEEMRREKNIHNISNYDASQSTVMGVLVHSVNYYPREKNFQWAETVQEFARLPGLLSVYPKQSLMLGGDGGGEIEGTTHWAQDKAAKATE